MTPQEGMQRACRLAEAAAARDEVPIGAILVLSDSVVFEGANDREASSRTTAHAELVALEKYNQHAGSWRLPPGSLLYVTVEPCLMCTGALLWARLDHLFYGCPDTKNAGLQRVLPLIESGVYDHRFKSVTGEILKAECAGILSRYFQSKRQTQMRT